MIELAPDHDRQQRVAAYERALRRSGASGSAAYRALMRALATGDLFFLLTRLLGRADLDHDWLYARCQEVQAAPDGRLDLWAREHGKTSIISFGLTIQDILRDPEITVGIFSHTRRYAKAILRQIRRELERNDRLKMLFDDVLWDKPRQQAPQWSDEDGIVVRRRGNPKEATLEAWGLIDGLPTGKHFRLRVYDGLDTVRAIVTRYAPPSENATGNYIANVAAALSVKPDDPIDLSIPGTLALFLKAVVRQECGAVPYPITTILAAVQDALAASPLETATRHG